MTSVPENATAANNSTNANSGKSTTVREQQVAERMAFIAKTRVRSAMVWDVLIPPSVNSLKGHFVPKFLHSNRERRISVEIRTPVAPPTPTPPKAVTKTKGGKVVKTTPGTSNGTTGNDGPAAPGEEFTVVRIFVPSTSKEAKVLIDATKVVTGGVMTTAALAGRTAKMTAKGAVDATTYLASGMASGVASVGRHQPTHQKKSSKSLNGDGDRQQRRPSDSDMSMSTLGVRGVDDPSIAHHLQNKEHDSSHHTPHNPLAATTAATAAAQAQASQQQAHWIEKYCLPLDNVVINSRVKNICVVTTSHVVHDNHDSSSSTTTDDLSVLDKDGNPSPAGGTTNPNTPGGININAQSLSGLALLNQLGPNKKNKTREITFQSEADAINFDKLIRNEKKIAVQKSKKKIKEAMGQSIDPSASIKILVEIVSGWDLPVGDLISSDPFVVVKMGSHNEKEVHRTKHASKTLNPVWTIKSQSLFLLSTSSRELFKCFDGVLFEVRDYDAFGDNEVLGRVYVQPKVMYEAKGERMEFELQLPPDLARKQPKNKKPILVLRFRHATTEDMNFMADLARTGSGESPWKPKGVKLTANMLQRNTKTDNGIVNYRMRPGPDPKRKNETEWMTEANIEKECYKESNQWLEAGSGTLGQVYVEVLKCTGLPNMDTLVGGVSLGNKTDAFVCLVYEDCLVQTDVINDCLSPKFMPWSNRAFIFQTMHPSSPLYIGVFDFDVGDINDHDAIGRISVDISKLQPKLEYTLTYNLYESSGERDRKPNGSITIRVRVDCDIRQRLLSSIESKPPDVYINCRRKKDFELARFTVEGEDFRNKYSLKQLSAYVAELTSYQIAIFYVKEGLYNLLLWRGNVEVELPHDITRLINLIHRAEQFAKRKIKKEKYKKEPPPIFPKGKKGTILDLPVHSFLAFLIGITLLERPHFIPSFWLGCFGWMMLAVMELQLSDPSPWTQFLPFQDLAWILVYGHPLKGPRPIREGENAEQAIKFREYWTKKIEKAEAEAAKRREEMLKLQNELAQQMEDVGDGNNISTQSKGFSVDPIKPYLFPIQLQLQWIVDILRVVRNVIVWEEFYYSFWLTAGSFALSVLFLFIPWRFFTRWITKILTWALLGPWMKLADIYYFRIIENLDEDGKKEREERQLQTQKSSYDEIVRQARIVKEQNVKIRDMKVFKFGKFIAWVPILKVDRYNDEPLASSKAEVYEENLTMVERAMQEAGKDRIKVPGQHLEGTMIPKPAGTNVLLAKGQPTMKPAPEEQGNSDSASKAYIKVGSIVVGAAVLTWFGVPVMASMTNSLFR